MRHYLTNSPEAAARILVMALIADCDCSPSEMHMLESRLPTERLGLSVATLHRVIHEFCEDLLLGSGSEWNGSTRIAPATRSMLLGDITDPALQAELYDLCQEIIQADGHLADGESALLDALREAWPAAVSDTGIAPAYPGAFTHTAIPPAAQPVL